MAAQDAVCRVTRVLRKSLQVWREALGFTGDGVGPGWPSSRAVLCEVLSRPQE